MSSLPRLTNDISELARKLHKERVRAAKKFEQAVEKGIAEVAIDNARFQVQVNDSVESAGQKGIDHTEFYFSANVGEEVKPLARVASGGEASRSDAGVEDGGEWIAVSAHDRVRRDRYRALVGE